LVSNDKGFSLVELLVAITVSAIVLLGMAFFMVSSTKTYEATNDEVFIQAEAQDTLNLLKNFIMEGKDFQIIKDGSNVIGLKIYNESQDTYKYNYIIYKASEGKMYFDKKNEANKYSLNEDPTDPYVVTISESNFNSICNKKKLMSECLDTNGFNASIDIGKRIETIEDESSPSGTTDVEVEYVRGINVELKYKRGKSKISQKELITPRNSQE